MVVPLLTLTALFLEPALAGSGPWVISEGDTSVYMGVESQTISKLALSTGAYATDDLLPVDDGIETTSAKVVLTHGIRRRIEMDIDVPWVRVEANRPGGASCTSLGKGTCATTRGFAPITTRVKGLVLDELRGSPIGLSIGGAVRFGQWTSPTRDRVTNLGEGTTDIGPTLAIGRSGGLGDGYWSAHVDTAWMFRGSNVADASPPIPGNEWTVDAELLGGLQTWWSLGPVVTFWTRPQGVDVEDLLGDPALATDIDRFARLRAHSVRVGGKLLLRSSSRTTFVAGAWTTAGAVNNPLVTGVSIGLSVQPRPRNRNTEGG